MARAVYRRRHNWREFKLLPAWDRSGNWPKRAWLLWTSDYLPGDNVDPRAKGDVSARISSLIDLLRPKRRGGAA